jgi:tetratricopeptide (TPR) repeat protein
MIGEQRLRRGQIEKASRTFLRAAALRPERAAAWRGLGYCLLRLGQPREALQAYGRTVAIGPTQPTDYLYGAVAALAIGDPDSTLVLLDALAQTHEDLSEPHRAMAADYRARAIAKRPGVAAAS